MLEIDPEARLARVQPGVVLDRLRDAAAPFGLTFGPDPATHRHCTLGGMLGNDSCGVHSVATGRTSHNVVGLEVVSGDGLRLRVGKTSEAEVAAAVAAGGRRGELLSGLRALAESLEPQIEARFPRIPRRVSGYALDALLPSRLRPGAGAGGTGPAPPGSRPRCAWCRDGSTARWCWQDSPMSPPRPTTCRRFWQHGRSAWKGSITP